MPVLLDNSEVMGRVTQLRNLWREVKEEQWRIRTIMEGGAPALLELTGSTQFGRDLPTAHLMESGMHKLALKIGRMPDIKVDPRMDLDRDSETKKAGKRERIVAAYDEADRMKIQLAQLGRWVPSYAWGFQTLKHRVDADGSPYPTAELRHPIDCYPGDFGPSQRPRELMVARRVSPKRLKYEYPEHAGEIEAVTTPSALVGAGGAVMLGSAAAGPTGDSWDATSDGIVLVEYYDSRGCYVMVPALDDGNGRVVDFWPNPLRSGPAFATYKRISFDRPASQFRHAVGLMSHMAKYSVLALLAAEEATFRETNIIGELLSGPYKRGRMAVNRLAPGSDIQKPQVDAAVQSVFQEIDRLERHLRVTIGYSTIDDSQSPLSFATGQGLDRLGDTGNLNVDEYQMVIGDGLQEIDQKRLEWDDRLYGGTKKPLEGHVDSEAFVEMYDPAKQIAGKYRTRRVYGVMAGFDQGSTIVAGLQLLQGGIIDDRTMRENLHGLENVTRIEERITQSNAEGPVMEMLTMRAGAGDPEATAALVEMIISPDQKLNILKKYFTPQEPQLAPEEEAFFGGEAAGALPEGDNAITTLLSRLGSGGETMSGAQTVQTVA